MELSNSSQHRKEKKSRKGDKSLPKGDRLKEALLGDEANEVKSSAESSGLSKSNKQASVEKGQTTRKEVVEWREQDDPREGRNDSHLRPPPRWMTEPWPEPSIGPRYRLQEQVFYWTGNPNPRFARGRVWRIQIPGQHAPRQGSNISDENYYEVIPLDRSEELIRAYEHGLCC